MNEFGSFDIAFSQLSIEMREVYQLMGYDGHEPGTEIVTLVNDMADRISRLVTPRCTYRLLKGRIDGIQSLQIGDTLLNPGRIITHAMKGASYYAIYIVTIGREFDLYCEQLKKENDMLQVFIADAFGSVLAEAAVAYFMKRLSSMAASDEMEISNNYSPGYCDWLLEEQKKVFGFFPATPIGIHLTDSCLMLPVKSVSGIVAVGTDVKKQPYGCDICKMATCIKNKKLQK